MGSWRRYDHMVIQCGGVCTAFLGLRLHPPLATRSQQASHACACVHEGMMLVQPAQARLNQQRAEVALGQKHVAAAMLAKQRVF